MRIGKLRARLKGCARLLVDSFRQWLAHRGPKMGAALSFYAVLSLAPLAGLLLSVIGVAVKREAAREEITGQFRSFVGTEGSPLIETILSKAPADYAGLGHSVLSFVVLLIGASGVFGELQDSLNQIWGVASKRHPLWVLIQERLFSFIMIFALGVLMLASFLFSALIATLGRDLLAWFPRMNELWALGNSLISLVVLACLLALIFRVIPDSKSQWRDVWPGALLTALLFGLGKMVLGYYFWRTAIASNYGAAGPLILTLLWVFYSSQIFFYGAQFTKLYAERYGSLRATLLASAQKNGGVSKTPPFENRQ